MDHSNDHLTPKSEADLKNIEQLQDRSNLAKLYPRAKRQWSGELMSTDERNTRREAHLEEIGKSIRKHFFSIGLLAPLPVVLLALSIIGVQRVVPDVPALGFYLLPVTAAFGLLVWITIMTFKKVYAIFYDHAIRIAPFYATLIILLGLGGWIAYTFIKPLYSDHLVQTLIVGGIGLLWSIILSFFILFTWTTPKLGNTAKIIIMLCFGGALLTIAIAATVTAPH